jgi:hypothetical protein
MKNLEIINNFFKGNNENILICNRVSEEIECLYQSFITYFGKKNQIKIQYKSEIKFDDHNNDLFGLNKIFIISTNLKKNIQSLQNQNIKIILFTDYKNFKIFKNDYLSINAYNYESDIKTFIKNYLNIDDTFLIENILANPSSFYSETSKYLINKNKYTRNSFIRNDTNFILDIRKNIFDKKKIGNIQELFFKIKEEVKYKKFSFLTF